MVFERFRDRVSRGFDKASRAGTRAGEYYGKAKEKAGVATQKVSNVYNTVKDSKATQIPKKIVIGGAGLAAGGWALGRRGADKARRLKIEGGNFLNRHRKNFGLFFILAA
ncbi:MAG: hypothetical protein ABII01_02030, partial [Candidatus Woesearchaeota archaeon]